MAVTTEETQELNESTIKQMMVDSSLVIKKYVDERDSATKSELQQAIVDEMSGIEGLGENLEKLQELSAAFVSVFDENADGTITPEEIAAKLSLVQANIDAVAKDVEDFGGLLSALEDRVVVTEANLKSAMTDIAGVKATIEEDIFTKAEVQEILTIDSASVVSAVEDVFFPSTDDSDTQVL